MDAPEADPRLGDASPSPITDTESTSLARRAREGDRSAFHELYDRYASMIHAVLIARVAPADAEDLVQEVFLAAWRKLGSLRDESRVGAWLATIAKNRAKRAHARAPRPAEPLPDEEHAPRQPIAVGDSVEASRAALDCLQSLPEIYREPLAMRLVEGMSGPEIARALERTPETLRVQLTRGMKLLRERLARRGWS